MVNDSDLGRCLHLRRDESCWPGTAPHWPGESVRWLTWVNTDLSDDAAEFGRTALRILRSAGGDDLAPAAARGSQQAGSRVSSALGEMGAWPNARPGSGSGCRACLPRWPFWRISLAAGLMLSLLALWRVRRQAAL